MAICRECGEKFTGKRSVAAFCSTPCRKAWHNRRMTRGAQMYDAVMAMRYDRKRATELGIDWTFVCRMAEMFNAEDATLDVRKSYRDPLEVAEELGAMVNARHGWTAAGGGKRTAA